MIDIDAYAHAKQLVALLAAASVGFWVGGNYTATLAYESAVGIVATEAPAWVDTVQGTLWLSIIAAGIAVSGWIVLDWRV
jgi:hypothetical protein